MKTRREKFAGVLLALLVAAVVWLFFVWYASRNPPGPSRLSTTPTQTP